MPDIRSILAAVQNSSALQLVEDAQAKINPLGPSLVPALDDLVKAHQMQTRIHAPDTSRNQTLLQPAETIEVQGPPGSGKTAFLLFEAMTFLVPARITIEVGLASHRSSPLHRRMEVELGGRGPDKSVLLFALDHQSRGCEPVRRLALELYKHLDNCLEQGDDKGDHGYSKAVPRAVQAAIVARWLSRCIIWSPPDPCNLRLEDTFEQALRQAVAKCDQLALGTHIALILVDSMEPLCYAARTDYERRMCAWPAQPAWHRVPSGAKLSGSRRQGSASQPLPLKGPSPPLQGVLLAMRALQQRTKACLLLANGIDVSDPVLRSMAVGPAAVQPTPFFKQPQSWPYPSPFRMDGASALPAVVPPLKLGPAAHGSEQLKVDWHITLHLAQSSGGARQADECQSSRNPTLMQAFLRERRHGFVGSFAFGLTRGGGSFVPL